MRKCKDSLGQAEFNCIIKEFYDDNNASFNDTDYESSSLGSLVELLMEIADFFDQEVMSYDHSSIVEVDC